MAERELWDPLLDPSRAASSVRRFPRRRACCLLSVALLLVALLAVLVSRRGKASSEDEATYRVWLVGSETDAAVPSTPGALLIGGGTIPDDAFNWQLGHCPFGDFVVLRTSGDDSYNQPLYDLSLASGSPLNSVRTILFYGRLAAFDAEVLRMVSSSECVFFAGGDQSLYVSFFAGTPLQELLQSKLSSTTMSGTSAGLAILGHYVYAAFEGSALSALALQDPYYEPDMSLDNFAPALLAVPFLGTVFTDTHFVKQDRMGRLFAFLSRELRDLNVPVGAIRGLGVDEESFVALDVTTGRGTVGGKGTGAYLCTPTEEAEVLKPGTPLTMKNVACVRLDSKRKDVFDFGTFEGDGDRYTLSVVGGEFTSSPYGPDGGNSTSHNHN